MKRCLQIVASLRIGGAEKVARDIGMKACQAGFKVDYLVFGEKVCAYESELENTGCRVIHIPAPSEGYIEYFKTLKSLMRANRYDIVHAHTMFNCGWAMLAARLASVPVRIAHAHSALNDGKSVIKQAYEYVMRRLILNNATDFIACGDAAGVRLFGKKAYEKSGRCILNGIDVDQFAFSKAARDRVRVELNWQDAFVIGHVGHLAAVKNQTFLLRLRPKILKKRPNARLLLLGEGEDRPMLEQLICDMGLENDVIMTGNVSNVSDYLSAMDVFAFPSLYEGMPLSVVEVQANGLPCILSTGVPKDVYLTDLIQPIPLNNKTAWLSAICTAERHNSILYASVLNERGFDLQSVMKKFITIYESADEH